MKIYDRPYVEAEFKNMISKISIPIAGSSGIISVEGVDSDSEIDNYKNVLKNMASIIRTRNMLAKDIEKYEEYLA